MNNFCNVRLTIYMVLYNELKFLHFTYIHVGKAELVKLYKLHTNQEVKVNYLRVTLDHKLSQSDDVY